MRKPPSHLKYPCFFCLKVEATGTIPMPDMPTIPENQERQYRHNRDVIARRRTN